jgi:hypothetical protein
MAWLRFPLLMDLVVLLVTLDVLLLFPFLLSLLLLFPATLPRSLRALPEPLPQPWFRTVSPAHPSPRSATVRSLLRPLGPATVSPFRHSTPLRAVPRVSLVMHPSVTKLSANNVTQPFSRFPRAPWGILPPLILPSAVLPVARAQNPPPFTRVTLLSASNRVWIALPYVNLTKFLVLTMNYVVRPVNNPFGFSARKILPRV